MIMFSENPEYTHKRLVNLKDIWSGTIVRVTSTDTHNGEDGEVVDFDKYREVDGIYVKFIDGSVVKYLSCQLEIVKLPPKNYITVVGDRVDKVLDKVANLRSDLRDHRNNYSLILEKVEILQQHADKTIGIGARGVVAVCIMIATLGGVIGFLLGRM